MLLMKKNPGLVPQGTTGSSKTRESWALDEDWVITESGIVIVCMLHSIVSLVGNVSLNFKVIPR